MEVAIRSLQKMRSDEYRNMAARDQRHWFFVGMKRIQMSILDSYYRGARNLKILDAGSGTCWLTQALAKYGEVTALDISEDALRVCRERGVQNIVQSDVASTPFADAAFDVVVCSEVLYHQYVKDDSAVMKEFNRLLKIGGRVLVKVPAHAYLWGMHDSVNLTRHRYEPQELRKLFTDNGFTVEKITYANFFLFPIVYIKRKLERRTPDSAASDITETAAPINAVLLWILSFEAFLISHMSLPQGSSLIGVGLKTAAR